jgi:thymidylate synthase (FAD)
MKVKLISYSQPPRDSVRLEEASEELIQMIAYCARVSNPSNQNNTETSEKLVKYLADHKHFSPFEMVNICLEVETTRDIARQFLRHRSFTFQEFSQRYADPTEDLSFVLRECRLQDNKNRQNSIDIDQSDEYEGGLSDRWNMIQEQVIEDAKRAYNWAIDNGIAKEQARAVLPEGNTMSRMYVNGTIRSWMHYVDLRSSNGTQKEHMELAVEIARVIAQIFPQIGKY